MAEKSLQEQILDAYYAKDNLLVVTLMKKYLKISTTLPLREYLRGMDCATVALDIFSLYIDATDTN